jgi:hypothetical protein
MRAELTGKLLYLRYEPNSSPVNRGMLNRHTALIHDRLEVRVAQRVQGAHLTAIVPSAEETGRSLSHRNRKALPRPCYSARLTRRRLDGKAEVTYQPLHLGRLLLHAGCSGRSLFDKCSVLLGGLIHLYDRRVHLIDADALLAAGNRNFCHDVGHTFDASDDVADGSACLLDQHRAGTDLGD